MSKVSEAKAACGYKDKALLPVCSNCLEFSTELVLPTWMQKRNAASAQQQFSVKIHGVEKNLRCKLHGFAVKRLGSCNNFRQLKS